MLNTFTLCTCQKYQLAEVGPCCGDFSQCLRFGFKPVLIHFVFRVLRTETVNAWLRHIERVTCGELKKKKKKTLTTLKLQSTVDLAFKVVLSLFVYKFVL